MIPDLSMQEQHLATLREWLYRADGSEASAYVLFGRADIASDPWSKRRRIRFVSHEVIEVPESDRVSADANHVTWLTDTYVKLLKKAKNQGLVVGVVHTHPQGPSEFSGQDNSNEGELSKLACNRNGSSEMLISILLSKGSEILARVWIDKVPIPITKIRVIGRQYFCYENKTSMPSPEHLQRQSLLFGEHVNKTLRSLKIGIVGCGGTGSAVAMLLARLGVGYLALIDDDLAESTNLNRLHGAKRSDVDAMMPKVEIVAREIYEAALGVKVIPYKGWVGNAGFRDVLKSCDIIFGCTDDHDGRSLLNRLAYFYLVPVIDLGLAITPLAHSSRVRDLTGRTTIIIPSAPCLICHGVVNPRVAREESLKRNNPEEFERQKREAYIVHGQNPAPAVVTFTTATACMAVDELLQGLASYRQSDGWLWQHVRRFDLLVDRMPGAQRDNSCPICEKNDYWGRGDVEPFLDRVG